MEQDNQTFQQLKNHHITIQQLNDKIDFLMEHLSIDKKQFNLDFAKRLDKIYNITSEVLIEEYNMEEQN